MGPKVPKAITRARDAASGRWTELKRRRPSVDHLARAWTQFGQSNGNLYAAAITYFSFLAIFPLLLLAVAITGFVLHAHPAAQATLLNHISENVPGSFGTTLRSAVNTAIKARTGVGIVGLLGVALTGLGWVRNLRASIHAVWGLPIPQRNAITARLHDLLVLAGLGLAMLVSLGITAAGTALTDQVVRGLGWSHVYGMSAALVVVGVIVGVLADLLIFGWLIVRLPDANVPFGLALRGALLASVGFEILKILGTVLIAHTSHSPTAGPFAGVIAILVWLQLVARYLLLSVAWTATGMPSTSTEPVGVPVQRAAGEDEQGAEQDDEEPDAVPAGAGAAAEGRHRRNS